MCECIAAGYMPVRGKWKMFQNKNITSTTLSIIIAPTILTTTRFQKFAMKERLSFGFRDSEHVV